MGLEIVLFKNLPSTILHQNVCHVNKIVLAVLVLAQKILWLPTLPNSTWLYFTPLSLLFPLGHFLNLQTLTGPSLCSRPFPALADFTIRLTYLVDVMLLADDGKREKGAGVRGVILWNEELGKGGTKVQWNGSEDSPQSRESRTLTKAREWTG